MNYKKMLFAAFVLLFSISILFAAGQREAPDEEVVTLRFAHWFFGHGGNFEEWIDGAVDAFEAEHPNIRVEREHVPFDQYWERLDVGIAGGNPPDIAAFGPGNLGKYIAAGALAPLNDLIDMNDINQNFSALQTESIPAAADDGKTYALAFDSGLYLPLYRPSVFEEAGVSRFPEDLDEFIETAQQLTRGNRYGFAFMNMPGNWNEQRIDMIIWTVALGGHFADEDGLPALDSKEVIQAVTYLKKLHDLGVVPRDTDKGTYRQMFSLGEVGILIDGMWMYGLAKSWDPTAEDDFDTALLPFPTDRVAGFYEAHGILSQSRHPEEAAKLISYLSNEEQQERLVRITQLLPPRTSVFTDELKEELVNDWPWYEPFIQAAEHAVLNASAAMPGDEQVEVYRIWGSYFDRVLFENMDPAAAMREAQREAMRLF